MTECPKSRAAARFVLFAFAVSTVLVAAPAVAQPTLSKVFTPSTIGPGGVSTTTFTITNGSASPVTSLAFTDVLPAAITIADPANASTSCDLGLSGSLSAPDGASTILLSDAQLGGSASCTVTVDVTASTPGVHTNPAVTLTSSAGSSMSLPIDLTVVTTLPGFSKSFAPSSVSLGGRSTLTFTIDNSANASNVLNLDFTDNLPSGMAIADPANASTTCGTATIPPTLTAAAGTTAIVLDANGTFAFPAVGGGATCTVTVDVATTGAGMLDNVSDDLLADFTSAGRASDTLEVTVTPLAIQKDFTDDPVPPGGTVTLDFRIDNLDRNFSATAVAFTDNLTTLVPPLAGLTFGSLLSNTCGGSVSGVGGTTIGLSGATVAAQGFCTLSVSLDVPAGAVPGSYTNTTSTVTGTVNGSPVVGNMATEDLLVEPVPILTKEFLEVGTLAPDPVIDPGDSVVIRFTITNTSTTSGATAITFIDELTDGGPNTGFLPFPVSVTLPPTPNPPCGAGSAMALVSVGTDRQGLELTAGNLTAAPGAGATCSFDVIVNTPAGLAPSVYSNTTGQITATVDGATRTGSPASDTLIVSAAPQLTKAFTDDPVGQGGTVTLEYSLEHSSGSTGAATGITFTDDLVPVLAGLTANVPPTPNPPCGAGSSLTASAGNTLLTLMGGSLNPGEVCTFSVTLNVPAGASPGFYSSTTSGVAATVNGLATTSPAASDDLQIAGLVFSKQFLGDPVIAGDTLTLRFTIDNIHPTQDATITFFTDNLAAALPSLAATGGPSVDTCGGTLSGTTFLTYVGGSVMSGMSCMIEVDVLVPAAAADGTYSNVTSSLSANQGGAVTINPATDDLDVTSNLLQLTKSFTDDPVAPGDSATLELTLTNLDAAQAASAIAFTDDLGAALTGLTFASVISDTCLGTVGGTGTDMVSVSGVSLAASASCTIELSLTVPAAATAGLYTNTTSGLTGTIGGFPVTGDPASDVLEVVDLLLFSKSFSGPTTATGTTTLTFTITNPGASTATGIAFTDDLDAVISGLIAISLPAAPCGAGSSISGISFLALSGGELPPMGGTCSFDVDVLVPVTATAGSFPNVTSDLQQAGLAVANPATASLVIEPPPTFSKVFAPSTIGGGGISTLTFTIDNAASAIAASSLAFTDNLPAGVLVSATPNATSTCGGSVTAAAGTGVISLSGGSVGAGATCMVQADVTSAVPGMYVNTSGDLTSSSGNSGTATDTLTVIAADKSITKSDGVTTATPGGALTYTIVAANAGPAADPSVMVADTFPTDLTCTYTSVAAGGATGNTAAGAGDLAETLSMPAGSSVTYTVSCNIAPAATGTLSNTATISGSVADLVPGNDSATDNDTVLAADTDLAITKDDGGVPSVAPGGVLSYNLTVTNNGPSASTGATVTDVLPAGVTFASSSTGCTDAAGTVTCVIGALAPTASAVASFDVNVSAGATAPIVNVASVAANEPDSNAANDNASATTSLVPVFTKAFAPAAITPGATSTLTLTLDNAGGAVDATGADFTDTLPAPVAVATPANAATTCTGGTLTAVSGSSVIAYTGGTVPAGAVCTVVVDVTSTTPGLHVNTTGDLTSSLGNSGAATATLDVGTASTTVTVTNQTAPFSSVDQTLSLAAMVTDTVVVDEGTVTFQLLNGATPIGTAVTSATLTTGNATVSYVLPGGTPAGMYTIEASYSGGPNFSASIGNGLLDVTPAAPGDIDGDGVLTVDEDAGPNGGDANEDGILDSLQSSVTSLPSAVTTDYITLEAVGAGCRFENVAAVDPSTLPPDSSIAGAFQQPQGSVAFDVTCAATTVTVIYHGETDLSAAAYRKYGPTPSNATPAWYTLPATFGTTTIAAASVATANFALADGALGDSDVTANGRIVDPGGAALSLTAIPSLSQWAMVLFGILLAGAALLTLRGTFRP